MKFSQVLPCIVKTLSAFPLGVRSPKLGKLDFAILKVAMMVAALDGDILESEISAFMSLARKCRGYTLENAKKCLDEALRTGGYLMAIAKVGGYSARRRIDAFVNLAVEAMPRGFVDGDLADLRRAFVLWVAMGVSDGDFSDIERRAVDALQDRLAQVTLEQSISEERRWVALSPAYRAINGMTARTGKITLLEAGFIDKAASLVKDLSIATKCEKAKAALAAFIAQA